MTEKFIELPQGYVVLDNLTGPMRLKSGKVTGSRYFVEVDPSDDEGAIVGRRKGGVYLGYSLAELTYDQLEKITTRKQVDALAKEILDSEEDFYEADESAIPIDAGVHVFLEEEERELEELNRYFERRQQRLLHPFKKREPDQRVRARYARMWNSRNVKNGQIKLEI